MIQFLCDTCGAGFDSPLKITTAERLDGHPYMNRELLCPVCGQPHFSPADECPACGGPKYREDTLCPDCRKALKDRFIDFADGLTAEEEAQLDRWLDGESVESRRRWT